MILHYICVTQVGYGFDPDLSISSCGKSSGCVTYPKDCDSRTCDFAVSYKAVSNGIRFRLMNKKAALGASYSSLGISLDERMVILLCLYSFPAIIWIYSQTSDSAQVHLSTCYCSWKYAKRTWRIILTVRNDWTLDEKWQLELFLNMVQLKL
mgnify:CR=1 FL=1